MSAIAFTAAHFALALFGLPAAFHPSLRGAPHAARAAAAFAAGAVALTLEATLLSIFRVPWSVASLSLPLLGISLALTIRWSRRPFPPDGRPLASGALGLAAAVIGGLALLHLVLSLATARATSADFLFFWGVKGARFAAARGIDRELLGDFFSHHMVPDYPPLVPILNSWGTLVAGELPWQFAPVLSALWILAATPLLLFFLSRTLPARHGGRSHGVLDRRARDLGGPVVLWRQRRSAPALLRDGRPRRAARRKTRRDRPFEVLSGAGALRCGADQGRGLRRRSPHRRRRRVARPSRAAASGGSPAPSARCGSARLHGGLVRVPGDARTPGRLPDARRPLRRPLPLRPVGAHGVRPASRRRDGRALLADPRGAPRRVGSPDPGQSGAGRVTRDGASPVLLLRLPAGSNRPGDSNRLDASAHLAAGSFRRDPGGRPGDGKSWTDHGS